MAIYRAVTMCKRENRIIINMGCIYNGVYCSLVALFLWQQVTHLDVVLAHFGISLSPLSPSLSLSDHPVNCMSVCRQAGATAAAGRLNQHLIRVYVTESPLTHTHSILLTVPPPPSFSPMEQRGSCYSPC